MASLDEKSSSKSNARFQSLVWTVCANRKSTMSEDEFHAYMTEKHAPLAREALARHGITQYSLTHFTAATKAETSAFVGREFDQQVNYDLISQVRFPSIQCFVNFQQDPFFKEYIMPDQEVFADPPRCYMSFGWIEDFIHDGKIV